jgi:hypothetical protein
MRHFRDQGTTLQPEGLTALGFSMAMLLVTTMSETGQLSGRTTITH